jgi:hypothetical protein
VTFKRRRNRRRFDPFVSALGQLQEIVSRLSVRLGLKVVRPVTIGFCANGDFVSIRVFDIRVIAGGNPIPHLFSTRLSGLAILFVLPTEGINRFVWILVIPAGLFNACDSD